MARAWATALLLMMATLASAGCGMPCTWPATDVVWKQAGVYAAMPSAGSHEGFEIVAYDDHGGPDGPVFRAARERWRDHVDVVADVDDTVTFQLASKNRLDDHETGRYMNATFDALGPPPPRPGQWAFHWATGIC